MTRASIATKGWPAVPATRIVRTWRRLGGPAAKMTWRAWNVVAWVDTEVVRPSRVTRAMPAP